jgi:23S rRNA-/tRNA-specific pseudouridylate synthase
MANNRDDQRSAEMQRLDREVTGNSVNARTAQTAKELHENAEALDRKYAEGGDNDTQDRG